MKLTPDQKLEKIIEQQEEVESDFEELETEDDGAAISKEEEVGEQVRFFISDTLNQAIQLFSMNELKIVGIGDSLTQGVGDPTNEGGYIGILNRMINKDDEFLVDFENYGKRGTRTSQLLNIIEEADIKRGIRQADIIIISIGANDVMQVFKENFTHLTLAPFMTEEIRYESRLENIFSNLRLINRNAHIYLLGFYNPFGQHFEDIEELDLIVNNWNDIGEDLTNTFKNISFIPIKDLFENETNSLLAEDFFHPNYEGYKKIAERILNYLIEEGDDQHER